jgi:hypothetical protein
VIVPFSLTSVAPLAGSVADTTVNVWFVGCVSFASTLIVTEVPSCVVAASLTAFGPVAVVPQSRSAYVPLPVVSSLMVRPVPAPPTRVATRALIAVSV